MNQRNQPASILNVTGVNRTSTKTFRPFDQ